MMSNLPQQPPLASAANARFMVSWWDREIHIWSLRKPATELFESGTDDVDINQNRKLLKTIVVKGDCNITSAALNQDGTLLVVSTPIDVKAFRLEHQDPTKPSDVKIHSLELPQKLTRLGATQVKLSPDGKWVLLVQEGSRVLMARITLNANKEGVPAAGIKVQRLARLRRHVPRYIMNGGLGGYDRSVTQAAFSADSKMVAVADLAGYMDTWILRGHEESLRNGQAVDGADDAASSSDSDSSDDEADAIDVGEQWIRNPNAEQLPKLPSAPVVLSFTDDVPGSGDASSDDYTLAAITSSWNVLAFHPRQGALTPWSRRHPRKALPAAVQDLLDLPKGIFWQGSRMWVYGVSFLLMLDMGQDLPMPTADADGSAETQVAQGTKRKRASRTTGAGGKMERENLVPHKVRKHGEEENYEDINVGETPRAEESDSDDEMADADGELAQLRNNGSKTVVQSDDTTDERKKWWITYKYRPILGVVPVNRADQPLEVALVERPTWDVDMPDRYFAGHEWEKY